MSSKTPEERLDVLETKLSELEALIVSLEDVLCAHKHAYFTFQTDLQLTIGMLIRQVQGESGLINRTTTLEAQQYALNTQVSELQSFDTQQKRGPSTIDLANQLADLARSLERLQNADRYSLTREKLGRLMVAHNLVSHEELAQAEDAGTAQVESTAEQVASTEQPE